MIPFVDVVYDGDDYEFEISLEPKDPCCFGFKVVYHNGSFLLLQNIESIDISCVQEWNILKTMKNCMTVNRLR